MFAFRFSLFAFAAAAAAGCQNKYGNSPIHDDRGAYNAWTIEAVNDGGVRNAIIAMHTLYPYHFEEFSDQLNDLGRREVQVLAGHYRRYPGEVNLRRGPEAEALYDARVRAVAKALETEGVAPEAIRISDGMPGGDGIHADRVIAIMDAEHQRLSETTTTPWRPTESAITTPGSSTGMGVR